MEDNSPPPHRWLFLWLNWMPKLWIDCSLLGGFKVQKMDINWLTIFNIFSLKLMLKLVDNIWRSFNMTNQGTLSITDRTSTMNDLLLTCNCLPHLTLTPYNTFGVVFNKTLRTSEVSGASKTGDLSKPASLFKSNFRLFRSNLRCITQFDT